MNTKLGPKTRNLEKLQKLGLKVPAFIGISADQFEDLESIMNLAHKEIAAKSYAVRSSALNEDGLEQSMAGQFHTELEVKPEDLLSAAKKVLDDAKEKLGDLKEFSLIVQEFIVFDHSGVCFTRDPHGSPEMIVETAKGGAAQVVQGEVTPEQERISWKEDKYDSFKSIETEFGHPQDIEWGVKSGQLYILQSRPITTLSTKDVQKIAIMEKALPQPPYYWEKNELTELAPQPCTHTLDLLKSIYAENGPVDKVYKKLGIGFQNADFLKMIGQDLYVDKLAEVHMLYPAYDSVNAEMKIKRLNGLWTSIRNSWTLSRPKTQSASALKEKLVAELNAPFSSISKKEFLALYELVFESNLLTGASIKKLELIHKGKPELAVLLSEAAALFNLDLDIPKFDTSQWKGNTLDISDRSKFQTGHLKTTKSSLNEWWASLSAIKKTQYTQVLPDVLLAQHNRELGRQLVVKLKSQLDIACKHEKQRDDSYPSRLTSFVFKEDTESMTLSPGDAHGKLIPLALYKGEKNVILLVDELKPELIKYFDKVNGMVTKRGGLLSHLAIVAREQGFPIIRVVSITDEEIGSEYEIST
jgi:hypothetical protein